METGICPFKRPSRCFFSEETEEININNSGKCRAIQYSISNEIGTFSDHRVNSWFICGHFMCVLIFSCVFSIFLYVFKISVIPLSSRWL